MAGSKSKNNPENRQGMQKNHCAVCDNDKTNVKIGGAVGKTRMVKECRCGMFEKDGTKVNMTPR